MHWAVVELPHYKCVLKRTMEETRMHLADYVIFGVLVAINFCVGMFFAFKFAAQMSTRELFLGSRTIKFFPLAVSSMASMVSSLGIVGFSAHYYAYGFHTLWSVAQTAVALPVVPRIVVPVLYKAQVTSIFEASESACFPTSRGSLSDVRNWPSHRSRCYYDGGYQ